MQAYYGLVRVTITLETGLLLCVGVVVFPRVIALIIAVTVVRRARCNRIGEVHQDQFMNLLLAAAA